MGITKELELLWILIIVNVLSLLLLPFIPIIIFCILYFSSLIAWLIVLILIIKKIGDRR